MNNPTTLRTLTGNPALEALELRDFGAADCTPTVDDGCPDPDDYPSDEDFARMERDAATVFGGNGGDDDNDPPPAGGAAVPAPESHPTYATYRRLVRQWGSDTLIKGVADAADGLHPFNVGDGERDAWLAAATAELLERLPKAA